MMIIVAGWALPATGRDGAISRAPSQTTPKVRDAHPAGQQAVAFTPEEITRILQHSPLPDAPRDATNRVAGDPAAARLGQFLFFDTRFSSNNQVSCATCHDPRQGFTDGKQLAQGLATHDRHAQSLWNVAHNRWFFWDGRADSLWSQALTPIEREDEFGGDRAWCAQVIFNDDDLRAAYERVFGALPDLSDRARFPERAKPIEHSPDDPRHQAWIKMAEADRDAVNTVFANVGKAIAAYETRIVSRDAPFDQFVEGLRDNDLQKTQAISDAAKRGLQIFVVSGNCRLCHTGPNFTDGEFHSVGVGRIGGGEPTDSGRYAGVDQLKQSAFNAGGGFSDEAGSAAAQRLSFLANKPDNWGQFKTPSLRNVALTAPYMHQGQYATLADVIEHYSTLKDAVQIGHHREKILVPLHLTPEQAADLEAFIRSLTSPALPESLVTKPPSPILPKEQ